MILAATLAFVGTSCDTEQTEIDANGDTDATLDDEDFRASTPPGGPSVNRLTARPKGTTSAKQGYYEYLPPNYNAWGEFPLLVFLHGLGENGNGSSSQLDRVLKHGPPMLIKKSKWSGSRPFVVLAPQEMSGSCPSADTVNAFIEFALENYNIDPDRVFLTGLSCGAYGVWNYLGKYKNIDVAAAVPIAGNGSGAYASAGCDLGKVPLWAFHGDADSTVNVTGTTKPVSSLQGCKPRPDVGATIYPGVGHDSWTRTYDGAAGHDIYAWMLDHTK